MNERNIAGPSPNTDRYPRVGHICWSALAWASVDGFRPNRSSSPILRTGWWVG